MDLDLGRLRKIDGKVGHARRSVCRSCRMGTELAVGNHKVGFHLPQQLQQLLVKQLQVRIIQEDARTALGAFVPLRRIDSQQACPGDRRGRLGEPAHGPVGRVGFGQFGFPGVDLIVHVHVQAEQQFAGHTPDQQQILQCRRHGVGRAVRRIEAQVVVRLGPRLAG